MRSHQLVSSLSTGSSAPSGREQQEADPHVEVRSLNQAEAGTAGGGAPTPPVLGPHVRSLRDPFWPSLPRVSAARRLPTTILSGHAPKARG